MTESVRLRRLRGFLQVAAVGLFLSTAVELLSVEHYADPWQFAPFVLCALGLLAVVADWRRPSRGTGLALRAVTLVVALGSVLGLYFHLSGNLEFAREIDPEAGGWSLAQDAFTGGNPLLASGVLVAGAAFGLAASFARVPQPAAEPAAFGAPSDAGATSRSLSPAGR